MLFTTDLPKKFQTEIINTAYYLVNRSPSIAIKCKIPEEAWSGKPVDYFGLKIFGCLAYVHVNDEKLEPRAKKYIFLRYGQWMKGYSLQYPNPKSPKFLISRDVTFDESFMLHQKKDFIDISCSENDKYQIELQFDASKIILEATTDQSIEEKL